MLYVTGDTHGEQERLRAIEREVPLGEGDVLFVCGDFGYLFRDDAAEHRFLDEQEARPYTLCFVDGNHENFLALYACPEQTWCGGRVHRLRRNVLHLMRGQVFRVQGRSFFTMGGAYSIDRPWRTEGVSWWPQELPTGEEYDEAARNLLACGKRVDYVLTHTLPRESILRYGRYPDPHDRELTGFLEWVLYEADYGHWYCGHWHDDRELPGRITLLWQAVRRL